VKEFIQVEEPNVLVIWSECFEGVLNSARLNESIPARKGKERKGKERKGKERKGKTSSSRIG
jgi:hypothetical protein